MFLVFTYNLKEGKEKELKEWLKKTGERYWESIPEIKSAKSYLRQFGIGQRPTFQTWLEISNFASLEFLDRWRTDLKRRKIMKEFFSLITDFNTSILGEVK